jgi:hypothetical protein
MAGAGQAMTAPRAQWLTLARSLCILTAVFAIGLYLVAVPRQYALYDALCSGASCPDGQLTPAGLSQMQQAGLSVDFYAGYITALNAGFGLVFAAVAAVIFWRKSGDWIGIYASLAMMLFGITFSSNLLVAVAPQQPILILLAQILTVLGSACFNILLYVFPDGQFVPGWTRWLVPLVILRETLRVFRPELDSDWYFYLEVGSGLFAQVYRYWRVSNAAQRQQTKWVVFGVVVGASGFLSVIVLVSTVWSGPTSTALGYLVGITVIYLFILLVPITVAIAILRSRLWDIDIVIRRTLIYGLLTALLAVVYLGAVVALQTIFTALTGSARSELVTVLSTLVIAALFVPLRNAIQSRIDRRFYRRKYDAARTLAQFGATSRDEVNLDDLSAHLLEAVDETMQPESVGLWLRARDEG